MAKHKAEFPDAAKNRIVVHPAHDIEKGVDGLNAARNVKLPAEIAKAERMEMLVQALSGFVGDEPEQLGRGENTVWDVSRKRNKAESRSSTPFLGSFSILTSL